MQSAETTGMTTKTNARSLGTGYILGLYRGYIRIMENEIEATI